jgi:anti-sigma factor RsiW
MTGTREEVGEDDLHAHLDGQLPAERAKAVDIYLSERPAERERWSQYAVHRQLLREAFAMSPDEPIPARLRVAQLLDLRQRQRRRFAALAAGLALFVLGGLTGWSAQNLASHLAQSSPRGIAAAEARAVAADAISAHRTFSVEVRHPVEVDVGHEAHLVQWLSKRLGRPLVVPNLSAAGFQLLGGRLLPAEVGPAAQFMYQNDKGERLTLYLRSGIGGETAFRYHEDAGIGAFYWSDQGFGYAIAAKADRNLLMRIAELVYQQTSGEGGKVKPAPPPEKPS